MQVKSIFVLWYTLDEAELGDGKGKWMFSLSWNKFNLLNRVWKFPVSCLMIYTMKSSDFVLVVVKWIQRCPFKNWKLCETQCPLIQEKVLSRKSSVLVCVAASWYMATVLKIINIFCSLKYHSFPALSTGEGLHFCLTLSPFSELSSAPGIL